MATRILLADDDTLMRQGLRQILEQNRNFEVIAEANYRLEAVELAERHHPGTTFQLRQISPALFLSTFGAIKLVSVS